MLLAKPQRVNLLKSNLLIFQEIKKYRNSLLVSLTILLACLIVYIGSTTYGTIINLKRQETLEQLFPQTVHKYLPKGTSRTNAIHILKNRVDDLALRKEKERKYALRKYSVSKLLADLSANKQAVSSLHVDRVSMKDQSVRIQGKVNSATDLIVLRNT